MKVLLKRASSLAIVSTLVLSAVSAQAGGGLQDLSRGNQSAAGQGVRRAPPSAEIMRNLSAQMGGAVLDLQALNRSGQYGQALGQAKAMLDHVRNEVGIDPKAKHSREIIEIYEGALSGRLKHINDPFDQIHMDIQRDVSRTIIDSRGGSYLDVLNLLKRVNLAYIEAFQNVQKQRKGGRLDQSDKAKIRQDILDVYAIPLFIRDPKMKDYYLVFDNEVANTDQNYFFNDDLKQFLLRNGRDLGIVSEGEFDSLAAANVQKIRQTYLSTLSPTQGPAFSYQSSSFKECVYKRNQFNNYDRMDQNWVIAQCEADVKVVDFRDDPEFDACFSTFFAASRLSSDAVTQCVARIGRK